MANRMNQLTSRNQPKQERLQMWYKAAEKLVSEILARVKSVDAAHRNCMYVVEVFLSCAIHEIVEPSFSELYDVSPYQMSDSQQRYPHDT